ncbi:MAG: DUF4189 domain-containing protein [Pseudomonadota bacterium]
MKRTGMFAALAVAATVSAPVHAGQCGYDFCWGAVAFNSMTGSYGYAHSYSSESQAAAAAQDGCRYDCPEVKTFYNQCGAAAVGANGGYGWGFGLSRAEAENVALSYCYDYDNGCQVLVWSCSP